jgi:hypothetical protein
VEKSKVDSVRSRLFGALRPYYQERDRLRLLIQYRKGSTRALACGFQRPRWNHASNHEDGLNCHASRPCREGATWNTARARVLPVIDTIAAAQQEELEKEIVSLQAEAERVAEEARELAGEVPF